MKIERPLQALKTLPEEGHLYRVCNAGRPSKESANYFRNLYGTDLTSLKFTFFFINYWDAYALHLRQNHGKT